MSGEVYLFWLLSLLQTLSAYGVDLSSEACRELGFSSNLLCSSCDLLGEFSLSKLQPDCRHCCQEEAQMEARKSARAWQRPSSPGCPSKQLSAEQENLGDFMLEPSLKCVDENWGGSLKSKLLSGAISRRCSRVFRSSM